jgi:hypothetical protein
MYFSPIKLLLSSEKYVFGIRPEKNNIPDPDSGVTKHRIPDPDPQRCSGHRPGELVPELGIVRVCVELQGLDILQILLQDGGPGLGLEAFLQKARHIFHKTNFLGLPNKIKYLGNNNVYTVLKVYNIFEH